MSEEKENKPKIIDADFVVEYKDGEIQPRRGFIVDAKTDRFVKRTATFVVKSGFSAALWTLRQVAGLMVEGISGTIDGVKDASELESKYDNKHRYAGHGSSGVAKRRTRPIWDIPTKEEEEMERRLKYG